jgi:hypothetical protein
MNIGNYSGLYLSVKPLTPAPLPQGARGYKRILGNETDRQKAVPVLKARSDARRYKIPSVSLFLCFSALSSCLLPLLIASG